MLYITEQLAQDLHDYLTTRPMREVEVLVHGVRGLSIVPEATVPTPPASSNPIEE